MAEVTVDRGLPGVGRNRDGCLEVFIRGSDGAIWQIAQRAPNNRWGGWASLGGRFAGSPVVGTKADGRLEVFVRGVDNAIYHKGQTVDGWAQWWATLGDPFSGHFPTDPVVSSNADGRLEVFAYNDQKTLQHVWQTSHGWSQWTTFAPPRDSALFPDGAPAVARNADGRLEVFAHTARMYAIGSGSIVHKWQLAPNNGWSQWAHLGNHQVISEPVAGRNADGRLAVFCLNASDQVHLREPACHIHQLAPNGGWDHWNELGVDQPPFIPTPAAVGNNADGRLDVFTRDHNDGQIWHIWQVPGGWSSWTSLGGGTSYPSPVVANNKDGRLEVFARGVNGDLVHVWQTTPNGRWSGWASRGRPG